jgi:hypothetical protein
MTLEEARRLRADRLARCRARAEALGYGRRPEAGLPEIEGLLDELEKETTHA